MEVIIDDICLWSRSVIVILAEYDKQNPDYRIMLYARIDKKANILELRYNDENELNLLPLLDKDVINKIQNQIHKEIKV